MRLKRIRVLLLSIFLGIQFLSISRMFFLHFWGEEFMFVFTYLSYGSLIFLPPILQLYLLDKNKTAIKFLPKQVIKLFFLVLFFFTIFGFFHQNPINYIAFDFSTLVCIVTFFILGTQKTYWSEVFILGFIFHILATILNIWGSFIITDVDYFDIMMNADKNNRVALLFLSYQTQFTLNFWPLILMKWKELTNIKKYLFTFSMIFIVVQQIIFQKRAPIGRIFAYIGMYFFSINKFTIFPINRKLIASLFIIMISFTVGISYLMVNFKENFVFNQVIGLYDRFINPNYDTEKVGILSMERFREVKIMLNTFDWSEHLLGKGFGGYYEDYSKFYAFRRSLETGKYTAQTPHIGIFDPYLKGGSILFLFYNLIYLIPIATYKFKSDDFNHTLSFIVVLFSYFFLFIEGFHAFTSSSFQIIVTNMSLGYLYNNVKWK